MNVTPCPRHSSRAIPGADRRCPACAAWRAEAERHGRALEGAVGDGLATALLPPRARIGPSRLAIAAAATAAAAVVMIVAHRPQTPPAPAPTEIVASAFAATPSTGGDINRDGSVDAADLALTLQR